MNRALVGAFVRQRLTSPIRILLIAMTFTFPLMMVAFTATLGSALSQGYVFALILAAGAIGQEVSSGVLQITFARPVSRPAYVTSRWAAATLCAAALSVAQIAIATVIVLARGGEAVAADVLVLVLENVLQAGAGAAVMVMLSSLVNGLGDVALWCMAVFTLQIAGGVAQLKHWTVLARVLSELRRTLQPELALAWLFGRGTADWSGLATVLSTIALGVAIAIVAVNRKELTYAAS